MNDSKHPHFTIAFVLAMTMALGPLAIDTYLPAFPAIAASINSNIQDVGLSISVYIFVLAIGQLVAGPLSDRFGRAALMYSGLGIFSVASFLISTANSLETLLLFRALQAFGGGCTSVCVPAIVRDRLSGNEAARFFSLIGLIMIVAPAIAPSIGSMLLTAWGWHSIFQCLLIYALFLLLPLKLVVFNSSYVRPTHDASISAWQRYRSVFAMKPALRYILIQSFGFSVILIFLTHSPFIYQQHFGVGPVVFSLLFAANIITMIVINVTNRHLLKTRPPVELLKWGIRIQALGILWLVLVMSFAPGLWLFLPGIMLTVGAMGAMAPNVTACYMEYFPQHGGTAAAVLGAAQFSVAGLISAASTLLPENVMTVVLAQAGCSLVCMLLMGSTRMLPK